MIIENGKRYVRADGEVVDIISDTKFGSYPFWGRCNGTCHRYSKRGIRHHVLDGKGNLVSEYIEPSPQYGPWIPWAGGECPVADGAMGQVQFGWSTRVQAMSLPPRPLAELRWLIDLTQGDIIYYRVLLTEPEGIETTALVHTEPGRDWQQARLAIVTVQGDKLGIEWAPKGGEE